MELLYHISLLIIVKYKYLHMLEWYTDYHMSYMCVYTCKCNITIHVDSTVDEIEEKVEMEKSTKVIEVSEKLAFPEPSMLKVCWYATVCLVIRIHICTYAYVGMYVRMYVTVLPKRNVVLAQLLVAKEVGLVPV